MKYFLAVMCGATAIILLFYFSDQGVLELAAKYASDNPRLIRFMRDMGYPKIGEWCGEFAASVIEMAGGTPPSGAAIASNWRTYGTPDAMPHIGDVAVADRGVPTGETGSHVGFVTGVDVKTGTFTLESGNASNIYTIREISCFSFHTPPNNVLSALIGNGVPSGPAIKEVSGLPLSRAGGVYSLASAELSSNPDDCSQGNLTTGHYDEVQNSDSAERLQASSRCDSLCVCLRASATMTNGKQFLASSLDRGFPPSDTDWFATRSCAHAGMTPASGMYRPYRRCAAATEGRQCHARRVTASACFI